MLYGWRWIAANPGNGRPRFDQTSPGGSSTLLLYSRRLQRKKIKTRPKGQLSILFQKETQIQRSGEWGFPCSSILRIKKGGYLTAQLVLALNLSLFRLPPGENTPRNTHVKPASDIDVFRPKQSQRTSNPPLLFRERDKRDVWAHRPSTPKPNATLMQPTNKNLHLPCSQLSDEFSNLPGHSTRIPASQSLPHNASSTSPIPRS